jgi:hypothetical protein
MEFRRVELIPKDYGQHVYPLPQFPSYRRNLHT